MNDMSGPPLADVSLADRYDLSKSTTLLNGAQAVARLLLTQKERDRRAGLNTGGFVTGYRGSPVGGLDLQFARLQKLFNAADIHFEPGLNEELAATAVCGDAAGGDARRGPFDGVFGLWYGKGPGVDRSGDVLRHANLAGTSPHGGVLALMGDDHTAESSTTAHQSEFAFVDVMMPILSPAGVQEILDYGALGWALSRYAGVWVGLKCIKDTDRIRPPSSTRSLDRVAPVVPADLHDAARRPQHPHARRRSSSRRRGCRSTSATPWSPGSPPTRSTGSIASGGADAEDRHHHRSARSYLDVRQALDDLGLDEARCNELGLRLFKLGCTWPIVPEEMRAFAARPRPHHRRRGKALADRSAGARGALRLARPADPASARRDESGRMAVPGQGRARSQRDRHRDRRAAAEIPSRRRALRGRVAGSDRRSAALADINRRRRARPISARAARTTARPSIPEGARAYAGIGCHFMAQFMDRAHRRLHPDGRRGRQLGRRGAFLDARPCVPEPRRRHLQSFRARSALRWAIDAKINVTYKILFNDAVAMTGGQRHEGGLTVPQIARQVAADGAKRVVVVDRRARQISAGERLAGGRDDLRPRDELIAVEKELSEDRRRHGADLRPDLRGREAPPAQARRVSRSRQARLHQRTRLRGLRRLRRQVELRLDPAEGDGVRPQAASSTNRAATRIFPASTASARPSSRSQGAQAAQGARKAAAAPPPVAEPDAAASSTDTPYAIVVTGVGGTGVVTIGAILGMAAHLEGKGCGMIDMAGLAQKGGAVFSHVKLARAPRTSTPSASRPGDADLILGCDLVVSGARAVLVDGARRARPASSSTRPRSIPATSPATPISRCRPSGSSARSGRRAGGAAKFVDATAAATAAARQFHRRQHVHARLRLSGRAACRCRRRRSAAPSNSTARRSR